MYNSKVFNIAIELWKTIPKKNKCSKPKWFSEEGLQIAEKRREAKSKGEKERYTHLNAEFQRIARRHKKAFLIEQCKEIEGNNRLGKTRDLIKKIIEITLLKFIYLLIYLLVNGHSYCF